MDPSSPDRRTHGRDPSHDKTLQSPTGATRLTNRSSVLHPAGERFGKFTRTELLGRGGGGEVWKAWDNELQRWAALKLPLGASDEDVARFQREAHVVAQLNHPNIVGIYEIGAHDGKPFIAMQFIEGRTLRALGALTSERAVRLIREAAAAVAVAHQHGIVHRDLKPENLMLDTAGRVFVMDFGLARSTDVGSELSQSGTVLGTPSYMPPEQARGERVDARADVYSLGATLHALLTGRPPFEGPSVLEICRRVIEEDPPTLRSLDLRVAPDLEAILDRCLRKNPRERYADAGELAEDLDRLIAKRPVVARRAGAGERMVRWAGRRKALVAVAVLAVALMAGAAVLLLREGSKTTDVQAQLVATMRSTAQTCLESAMEMRRADNAPGMDALLAKVESICREAAVKMPASAEPHYLLGRVARATMKDAEALTAQEEALKREPSFAPARYERLVLTARLHRRRMAELRDRAWAQAGAAGAGASGSLTELPTLPADFAASDVRLRELAKRLDEDLAAVRAAAGLSDPERACAEGIRLWLAGDAGGAKTALKPASALDEAVEALAEIELDAKRYDAAVALWADAIARDPGYAGGWFGRAQANERRLYDKYGDRQQRAEWIRLAMADDTEALKRAPGLRPALKSRGILRFNGSRFLEGAAARELIAGAVQDLDEALRLAPGDEEALVFRATVLDYWSDAGGPPECDRRAEEDLREALRIRSDWYEPWFVLGRVHLRRNERAHQHAGTPGTDYDAAVQAFDHAVQRAPNRGETWYRRGYARMLRGVWELSQGKDPTAAFDAAASDFAALAKLDYDTYGVGMTWGLLEFERATWLKRNGKDSAAALRAAFERLEQSIRASSKPEPMIHRIKVIYAWAENEADRGRDASKLWNAVVVEGREAMKRGARRESVASYMGRAHFKLGMARFTSQKDPTDEFAAAVDDLDVALRHEPSAGLLIWRGKARSNLGTFLMTKGEDPTPALEKAIEDYAAALKMQPDIQDAHAGRAMTWTTTGQYAQRRKRDPTEPYTKALEDYALALKRDPKDAQTWRGLGITHYLWSLGREEGGEDATQGFRDALKAFTEGVKLQPSMEAGVSRMVAACRRRLGE